MKDVLREKVSQLLLIFGDLGVVLMEAALHQLLRIHI